MKTAEFASLKEQFQVTGESQNTTILLAKAGNIYLLSKLHGGLMAHVVEAHWVVWV